MLECGERERERGLWRAPGAAKGVAEVILEDRQRDGGGVGGGGASTGMHCVMFRTRMLLCLAWKGHLRAEVSHPLETA